VNRRGDAATFFNRFVPETWNCRGRRRDGGHRTDGPRLSAFGRRPEDDRFHTDDNGVDNLTRVTSDSQAPGCGGIIETDLWQHTTS